MAPQRKNKLLRQLPLLLLLVVGTIYVIRNQPLKTYQRSEGMTFGTTYHATYLHDKKLDAEIRAELQRVDASLSMFNKNSVISRINRNETSTPDSLFAEVFRLSMQVSQRTRGAFDITVAPLVNAWGFGFKTSELPDSTTVDSLRALVGYERVTMTDSVRKADPRMVLDCSAVAKGFGSDLVARLFDRHGITDYMVEIGGEVVVKGKNPHGKPWRIGVNRPVEDSTQTNNELQYILVADKPMAMATSGNYRNFYYKNGRKYAHTINPHTGYPVEHSLLSATVVAPTCAMADAYATAFMVMGAEKAMEIVTGHLGLEALFICTDNHGKEYTQMTLGMAALIDPATLKIDSLSITHD